MSRLLLLALLTYAALAIEPCIIQDKKGKSDIHVIELDDSQEDSSEIVALHLSDRRRREVDSRLDKKGSCRKDEDCGPGAVCFTRLFCVKGAWRNVESSN